MEKVVGAIDVADRSRFPKAKAAVIITNWGEPRTWNWQFCKDVVDYVLAEGFVMPKKIFTFDLMAIYHYEDGVLVDFEGKPKPDGVAVVDVTKVQYGPLAKFYEDPYLAGKYFVGGLPYPGPTPVKDGITDFKEITGVDIMRKYIIMGGVNPGWDINQYHYRKLVSELKELYGDDVYITFGWFAYSREPQSLESAIEDVVWRQGITKLVIARETSTENNYALDWILVNRTKAKLEAMGVAEKVEWELVRGVGAGGHYLTTTPPGTMTHFNLAATEKLTELVKNIPSGETVAVIIADRGMPKNVTYAGAPYNGGEDIYHETAEANYLALKEAIEKKFPQRDMLILPSYAEDYDEYDPNPELTFSTGEQVIHAESLEYKHIIILPIHWLGDCTETLVTTLREPLALDLGMRRNALLCWDENFKTEFTYGNANVIISGVIFNYNPHFAHQYKERIMIELAELGIYPKTP